MFLNAKSSLSLLKVNGKLVVGNGSLIPICSLSNRSLLPSLTVLSKYLHILCDKNVEKINFYNECHLTKSPSCYHDSQLESNFIKKPNNLHRISAQCPRGNKKVSLLICMKLSSPWLYLLSAVKFLTLKVILKVSKSQKQNTKFSHHPKTERNICLILS